MNFDKLTFFCLRKNRDLFHRMLGGIALPILAIYMIAASSGYAIDDLSLSASLDKTDLQFDDSVVLNIEIRWPGDMTRYGFGVLPLPETQNLKVLGTKSAVSSETIDDQEVTLRKFRYTLKPTAAGVGIIEPIVLNYVSFPDSIPGQLATQRFQVIVAEPPPVEEPDEGWPYGTAITIIAVVIIMAGAFLWIRRTPPKEPIKTPAERFLEGLKTVGDESRGDRKIFFTKLFRLLSEYINNKYKIETAGKNAGEIASELEKDESVFGERERLIDWLELAEKEKFAPSAGEPGDMVRLTNELEAHFQSTGINIYRRKNESGH